jgi:hypothetical protein
MVIQGMDGVGANSIVTYFVLGWSAGVTIIIYGYLLSFVTDDILAAQQWITEFLNLSFSIPWLILTFAVNCGDKDNEETCDVLENVFSIIPGFAFYRAIGGFRAAQCSVETVQSSLERLRTAAPPV